MLLQVLEHDVGEHRRERRVVVGHLGAGERHARALGDPPGLDVQVEQDLEMVGDEPRGADEHRYGPELGDFIVHAEWRFTKLESDKAYNSGLFARASADGSTWFQAQTGATGGYLFGVFPVNGKPSRVNLRDKMVENRVKPAGEWNHYRVVCNDGSLKLSVNGKEVSGGSLCRPRKGYICLESEGAPIRFRNIRIMELPPGITPPERCAPVVENKQPSQASNSKPEGKA